MVGLRLYNTLTRQKDELKPLALNPETGKSMVRLYVCGPTVYDYAHIGNARPVIVFDVLFRLLRHLYGEENVVYTRNITDVDDKINARAARDFPDLPLNEAIRKVTEATNNQYQADVAALGCLPPTHQPRATEHIEEMRALCERLVERGVAYVAEGHVLFSPEAMNNIANSSEVGTGSREEFASGKKPTWPTYGKLANRSLDEMIAGARVDVAPYKRGATDFVLWKPSSEGEPGWPSPCGIAGNGRPGWHIECSAMSMATLLEPFGGGLSCDDPVKNTFDIHGGGIDLVFPHHENEIAQSCCAFGTPRMANIWMHNGFLQVEGQKMSKSLGNFITINELLATEKFGGRKWPGEVLRLAMLKTHYRQPIDWTNEGLSQATAELSRFSAFDYTERTTTQVHPQFLEALLDDLNTPLAVASLHALVNEINQLLRITPIPAEAHHKFQILHNSLDLLGISWNRARPEVSTKLESQINALINLRLAARAAKNWAESDRIRDELAAMGIALKDGKDADGNAVTTWEVKR